jgi:hypothetical protein
MSKSLPKEAVAVHWQSPGHESASDPALPLFSSTIAAKRWRTERLRADYNSRREEVTDGLYLLLQRCVSKLRGHEVEGEAVATGIDALVEKIDEKPSYGSNISRCLNRSEENRRAQFDWAAPILLDEKLRIELVEGMASLCGLTITVHADEPPPDEDATARAALDVLRDMQRAGMNTGEMLNRKLGRKPGTVKL